MSKLPQFLMGAGLLSLLAYSQYIQVRSESPATAGSSPKAIELHAVRGEALEIYTKPGERSIPLDPSQIVDVTGAPDRKAWVYPKDRPKGFDPIPMSYPPEAVILPYDTEFVRFGSQTQGLKITVLRKSI